LSVTDTTMESINISVSGSGETDDNTEGNLVVGPGTLDYFVVAHDGSAVAGAADGVTVTAYDLYANIKTNYAGTITLDTDGTASAIAWALSSGYGAFTDGGASVDTAAYTFVVGDNGLVQLTITDTKAESLDIDVSGSGKFDTDGEGNLVVGPDVLYDFAIVHDGEATAGVPDTVTVTARDFYDNTQTAYGGTIAVDTDGSADTIAWALSSGYGAFTDGGASVDTADYTFDAQDFGVVQLTVSDTTAESLDISVSGDGKSDDNTQTDLVVAPTSLASFVIAHDGAAIQSVEETIGVTAKDTYGNTKTNYTGTVTLDTSGTADAIAWALSSGAGAFTDGGASVDTAVYTFASGDSGSATFGMTDASAETINIAVSDGGITDDNNEGDLVVQASSVTVDAVANALSSSYVGQGATGRLLLDVTLTNNNVLAGDTLTQVVVNNAGSISDAQVQSVKLYYDSNNTESYTPGTDQQVGTGAFSSGGVTFSSLSVNLAAAGTERIFVVVDLAGSAADQATVDASIPSDGLTFASAPKAPATAINSSGSLTVDAGLPGLVSNLASSSHNNAIGAWNDPQSRDDTVYVSWTAASDAAGGSGIDGYAVDWDTNPTTLPEAIKDVEQTTTAVTSSALSDGTSHYVHIRSVDNVGNWSASAAHLGPFYIDTTPPSDGAIQNITEYGGGDYLYYYEAATTLYYSGLGYSAFTVYVEAADAGSASGLKQAVFPTTTSVGGTDATEANDVYEYEFTYEITSAGSSYQNVNVVVSDLAGNTANVPFSVVLDNTPPALVSNLSSSTHTPGVSSTENDVTFQWGDTTDSQSGVSGYSFCVDTNTATLPPQYINVYPPTLTYEALDLANGDHYGHVRPVDRVGNWTSSATHAGPYVIGRGALLATLATSKSVVSTDQSFTVTMTVTNSGSVVVETVDPSALTVLSPPGQNTTATTTSDPSPQNIGSSSQKQYVWNYTAGTTNGSLSLEGSASGYDSGGLVTSNTAKSADVVVEHKAALGITVSALPATPRIGETISVTVTITNDGQADALNVAPSLTPSGAGNPIVDTGPSPSSATIKGGASKSFSFTAHGQSTGSAVFTADLDSGVDENSGANLSASSGQDSVNVQSKPTYGLTSSLSATPSAVNVAGTITVTMSVQNTGENTVTDVTPTSLIVGGTSSDASLTTGPVPTSAASLGATTTQDFTWTYTAGTTLGTVTFAGYATSNQTQSTSTTSNAVTLQAEAAALTSSLTATPSTLLTNAAITVTMTVNNTAGAGGAAANNVKPSLLTVTASGTTANLETGPTPPTATITAGAGQQFVWSYEAGRNPGTLTFSGNASGTDANSSADVSSTATSSNIVVVENLSADWVYPTDANVKGPIRTIPIAYDDKIYFGSDDNNLYILDNATKNLYATFVSSGQIRGIPWPATEEYQPGVYKDVVYFGTLGCTVYAVWEDNVVKWERTMGDPLSTSVLYEPLSGIYFGTSGVTGHKVYCLEVDLGGYAWAEPAVVGGAIESSPAMIYVPFQYYDEIFFGASDGKMYAFKASDGTGARIFDTGFGSSGAIKSAPFIALQDPTDEDSRRLIFFGTANGRFYAVNLNLQEMGTSEEDTGWAVNPKVVGGAINSAPWVDTETLAVYFGSADGKLYAYNLVDGQAKANFPVDIGSGIDSWPLVANGIIYFGADDGKFYAVDTATGEIVDGWPYDTGAPIKSGVSLQYIDDDNIFVLVGSDSGRIYSFKTAN